MASAEASAASSTAWSAAATGYASVAAIPGAVSVEAARLLLEGHERDTVISFLDVAAGPATLAVEVLKRLSKVDGATGRAFVTDSAQGMLDAARDRLDAARLAGEVPPGVAVECALADGCDLGAFADGSMTHAGVMFGIMFYADVGRGLQELRRVLRAGGRAVVGTWRRAGVAELIADFARFLGLPPPDASDPTSPAAAAERMLRIGRDADALAADLRSAGFAGVSLHEVPVTFVSPDLPGFLAVVRGNPGMRMPLAAAPADTDWEGRWAAFLAPGGPGAAKWMAASADGSPALTVEFLANVAVATA